MRVATATYVKNESTGKDVLIEPKSIYEPMDDSYDLDNFDTGTMTFEAGYWHRFRRKMKTEQDIDVIYKNVRDAIEFSHANLSIAYFKVGRTALRTAENMRGIFWFIDMFYVVEDASRTPFWQIEDVPQFLHTEVGDDILAQYGPKHAPMV